MPIFSGLRRKARAKNRFDEYIKDLDLFRHCSGYDPRGDALHRIDPVQTSLTVEGLYDDCGCKDLFSAQSRVLRTYVADMQKKIARGGVFQVLKPKRSPPYVIWWVHTRDGDYNLNKHEQANVIGLKAYRLNIDNDPHNGLLVPMANIRETWNDDEIGNAFFG